MTETTYIPIVWQGEIVKGKLVKIEWPKHWYAKWLTARKKPQATIELPNGKLLICKINL